MDDLICELLNEPIVQNDNSIVFTSRAVELIHMISEKCKDVPIVQKTQEQAEEYAKDLTAEQVYVDMIYKIANAPTGIHMRMAARLLIPVIERKLQTETLKGN